MRCRAVGDDLVTDPEHGEWVDGSAPARRRRALRPARRGPRRHRAQARAVPLDAAAPPGHRARTTTRSMPPPTALRSTRVHRRPAQEGASRPRNGVERQTQLAARAAAGADQPLLDTEDVTRGLRVEVWDDTAKALVHAARPAHRPSRWSTWARSCSTTSPRRGSSRARRATETPDVDEQPGARPRVRVRLGGMEPHRPATRQAGPPRERPDEIVEDRARGRPDPVHPTSSSPPRCAGHAAAAALSAAPTRCGPGRSTSRASPAARAEPAPADPAAIAGGAERRPGRSPRLSSMPPPGCPAGCVSRRLGDWRRKRLAPGVEQLPAMSLREPAPRADRQLAASAELRARRRRDDSAAVDRRRRLVGPRSAAAVADPRRGRSSPTPRSATRLARASPVIASQDVADAAMRLCQTVTPLRPFLRWDPVGTRRRSSRASVHRGESLRRSSSAPASRRTSTRWRSRSRRPPPTPLGARRPRLPGTSRPPPRSAQDEPVRGRAPRRVRRRDRIERPRRSRRAAGRRPARAGTLFDLDVPRLDDPARRDPQPGVRLRPDRAGPATPKTLPLADRARPAAAGPVRRPRHAELRLPYLPDVLARGISLVFQEAGRDRIIAFPFGTEGFTARYLGDWPERRALPARARRQPSALRRARQAAAHVALPPGDVQRFRLASSLDGPTSTCSGVAQPAAGDPRRPTSPRRRRTAGCGRSRRSRRSRWCTPCRGRSRRRGRRRWSPDRREGSTRRRASSAPSTSTGRAPSSSPPRPAGRTRSTTSPSRLRRSERRRRRVHLPDPRDRGPRRPLRPSARWRAHGHRAGSGVHCRDPAARRHQAPQWSTTGSAPRPASASTSTRTCSAPPTGPPLPAAGRRRPERGRTGGRAVGPVVGPARGPDRPLGAAVVPLGGRHRAGAAVRAPPGRRAGVRIYLERPWYSSGDGELLGVLLAPRAATTPGPCRTTSRASRSSASGAPTPSGERPRRARAMSRPARRPAARHRARRPPGAGPPGHAAPALPLASLPGAPTVAVARLRAAVQRGAPALVRRRGLRPRRHVLAVRAPGRVPLPAGEHRRLPPVATGAVRLRAAPAGADDEREPDRRPPRARRRQWPRRGSSRCAPTRGGPRAFADAVSANRRSWPRCSGATRPSPPTSAGRRWPPELAVRGTGASQRGGVGRRARRRRHDPAPRPGANPDWRVTVEEWERLPGDPTSAAEGGPPAGPRGLPGLGAAVDLRRRDPALSA